MESVNVSNLPELPKCSIDGESLILLQYLPKISEKWYCPKCNKEIPIITGDMIHV